MTHVYNGYLYDLSSFYGRHPGGEQVLKNLVGKDITDVVKTHHLSYLDIDAYDWVMYGNVYCMSQFADGGMYTSRPYFSSSKYLTKMTNFPAGDWREKWDELFNGFLVSKKNKLKKLYLVSRWV